MAQQNNPLINSGENIRKGIEMHDNKQYSEALKMFKEIDRSDTNYVLALYEISNTYYADSQFDKSLEYAKLGMQLSAERTPELSMLAANALDDMGKQEEAIKLYDSAIAKAPYAYLYYFNKGIVSYKMKKYEDAKKFMQQCLLINPFYPSAHYFLGSCYLLQGNLVPAMLAYKTYLLVAPSGKYKSNVITGLSNISKVTDEINEYVANRTKSKEDDFEMQQDILLSKISFDKKYKLKADLEDNIVRQIQVVDEKLEYNKNDKGFCMQYYVPFYIKIMQDEDFESMIFTAFSGITNDEIEKWLKKNKKKKDAFIDRASIYFDDIKRTQVLDFSERKNAKIQFITGDRYVIGKGSYTMKGQEKVATGTWEYYHNNGALKAKGSFNAEGNKEGPWFYYYDNGLMKEKSNYINGELDGKAEGWFDNGNKWYDGTYAKGKSNERYNFYFYNGKLKSTYVVTNDLKQGEARYYDYKGNLSSSETYVDDVLNGQAKTYYNNGKLKNEFAFKNGKEEGPYKSYYRSGKPYLEGELRNGLRQGLWTTYYETGSVLDKVTYVDNEIIGEFTEYHENGKISRKGNYYKKKIDGRIEEYDDDGKIFDDAIYDRGKLKEMNFYDKSGKIISTSTTRKGSANIVFYDAEGNKTGEGLFDREGYKNGKFTSYYNSGKISEESNWKEGELDGEQVAYYSNGKVKKRSHYTNGKEDGYIQEYYSSGQLSSEGWRVEGERQQHYLFYNSAGDLTADEYYLDDEQSGYTVYYDPGKKPTSEYHYKKGWLLDINQFDTTGKLAYRNIFQKGNGPFVYYHPNGKKSAEGQYENYILTGLFTYYFFDGSISGTAFYKNDVLDSTYKSYYFGGKLRTSGTYKDGEKVGQWKYYYPNGKLREEEYYVDGKLNGLNTLYLEDGRVDKKLTYKNNLLEGPYEIFAEKDQLAVRLNFKEDVLKSYQYEEKPGVLSAPVIMKGATGPINARYPNGNKSFVTTFQDNLTQGERKVYYSNGKLFLESKRDNGFNEGIVKDYYPSGATWHEENYLHGNLHGISKTYYANGKLEKEENFYNDEKHGICKYYDELGKLKQTMVYYYGSLLSVK